MQVRWRIELFGGLRAELDSRVITRFQTRQTGELLAYLAFHLGRSHHRALLIELLWPECEPSSGRSRLSSALSSLRRQLEPPDRLAGSVILANRTDVCLNPTAVTTDLAEFQAALQTAARAGSRAPSGREQTQFLAQAVDRYRGGLLTGYHGRWITEEEQRLKEAYFRALSQLLAHLERSGNLDRALDYARQGVGVDPLREEAHLDLMRLLAATDQPSAAQRQYGELSRLLRQEYGLSPSAAAQALAQETRKPASSGRGQSPRSTTAPQRSPDTVEPSLPTGTITFLLVDRADTAAAELCRTLLGPLFRSYGGQEVRAGPEGFIVAFRRATDAFAAAIAVHNVVASRQESRDPSPAEGWTAPTPDCSPGMPAAALSLRVALHTGDVGTCDGPYGGPVLDFALRLLLAAHPGQILLSEAAAALIRPDLDQGFHLTDVGHYRLREGALPEGLFLLRSPGVAVRPFPPPNAPPAYEGHLPLPISRFFGGEEKIAQLCEAIEGRSPVTGGSPSPAEDDRPSMVGGRRLVTLTGPGGSGKTRLSVEVGHRLKERFRGAVWFVPLLDLNDAGLIPDKILDVMHLPRSAPLEPFEQVAAALSQQPSLLLLDNFEHLVAEGAPLVQTLLERTPTLTCLVTSRQPLGLTGEQEFPVAPLPVPDLQAFRPGARGPSDGVRAFRSSRCSSQTREGLIGLLGCPSVALFLDRAQAVRPDFQITAATAAAVAGLCQRLEGLPLAIELAAARIWVLTPAQMLERLEGRFELLTSRQRAGDPRHRSLRAALDWSYQLLSPELQHFFCRLSVFRGGWTVSAAEAVCAQSRAEEYLQQLRDCSLVLSESPATREAEMRFRLLETIREYALERLLASGEADAIRQRHAQFFLALAEQAEAGSHGAESDAWLERREVEHDNLRAALDWSVESGEAEVGLQTAWRLWWFWWVRGYMTEGQKRIAALLALPSASARTAARARGLEGAGLLAFHQGNCEAARPLFEENLAICRELGDKKALAYSLYWLGRVLCDQRDLEAARALHEESLALHRELGNRNGVVVALHALGHAAMAQADYEGARALYEESLEMRRQMGSNWGIACSLHALGAVARVQGDLGVARARHQEGLAMMREIGSTWGIAWSLSNLGDVALCQGDAGQAGSLLKESLTLHRELGDQRSVAGCLEGLAGAAAAQAAPKRAARLFGAAAALRGVIGVPLPPNQQPQQTDRLAALRASLGEAAFMAAWEAGQALTWDQAVVHALSEGEPPEPGGLRQQFLSPSPSLRT